MSWSEFWESSGFMAMQETLGVSGVGDVNLIKRRRCCIDGGKIRDRAVLWKRNGADMTLNLRWYNNGIPLDYVEVVWYGDGLFPMTERIKRYGCE